MRRRIDRWTWLHVLILFAMLLTLYVGILALASLASNS